MDSKYKNARFLFVVGIGGSDLASKAVWNALSLHKVDKNKPASSAGKKVFFLESPDSREYEEVEYFVQNEAAQMSDIALVVISKSGKTAETLEAYHKTFDILSEKFGAPITERVLIITSNGSPLWKIAEEKNIEHVLWEGDVVGRFSAFTLPHTTVLSLAGLDKDAFLRGEREDGFHGKASELALKIFENYKNGADILDLFFFNSELEDLGKWCRQLVAESLGKKNEDGERVGITPVVSIGPTDLHSMLQLTLGGPKNKFTFFVCSMKEIEQSINKSAYHDAVSAYKEAGLPFEKYEMSEISEWEIGKFMALMMATTLELARLLKVNPYDQPEVEKYKAQVKKV